MKRFIMKVSSVEDFSTEEFCIRLRGERSTTLTIYTDKSEIPPRLGDTFSVTVLSIADPAKPTGVVAEQMAAVERASADNNWTPLGTSGTYCKFCERDTDVCIANPCSASARPRILADMEHAGESESREVGQ